MVEDSPGSGMKLQWVKPDLDGGSPITGYTVVVRDTAGSTETYILTADNLEITLPNLEKGKPYEFYVAATNSNGQGSCSVCKLILPSIYCFIPICAHVHSIQFFILHSSVDNYTVSLHSLD